VKESVVKPDPNLIETSTSDFVQYYNKNIPETFPRASLSTLERFQANYPELFKRSGKWTIDKHRKKLMDWLSSHSEKR
jgi:hypothetical protein